jgi:hypothetical protein
MGIINAECGKTVRIAYQGENKRQKVRFDLADIMGEFPGGTAVLAVLRNGDADPVPAAETEMDGTALIWTVTAWECALEGFLYAQVTYAAGETVAKTKVYRFDVKNSLVVNGAEPEDWQDLVGQLVEAADGVNSAISEAMDTLDEKVTAAETAQSAAEDAQEAAETARDEAVAAVGQYDAMTAEATGLAAGEEPTAAIDHTGDHPVLQLGIPKGEKGDTGATGQPGPAGPSGVDGFSPTAGVSKVGKVATITIVDKNGTTVASVSDGADGDPGDIIDDTAGAGDTDVTFSADKLTADHSSLLNQIDVSQPTAQNSDIGKFLKLKTIDQNGKPTAFEYGSGDGSDVDELKSNSLKTDFLTDNIRLDYSKFELGNISITNNGWTYSASSKRVRTNENTSIHLPKGIRMGFMDYTNCRYYLGWYANETYYNSGGWLRADFVTPVEGDYVILLSNVTEVTLTSKSDLLDKFVMTKYNREGVGLYSPLLNRTGIKFIAHRGACTDAPENTVPAFEIAGQNHVWGIETDIWETTDNYFVCLHDERVDSMTDGSGKVRDKTLAEVKALTIDAGANIQDYPNLQIPTLEEYLAVCKKYGSIATIEVKGISSYEDFVETITEYGLEASVILLVWYESEYYSLRLAGYKGPIVFVDTNLSESNIKNLTKLVDVWITANKSHITSALVTKAHEENIPIIGYAYDTKSSVIDDLDKGIDVPTTNGVFTLDEYWQGGSY